MPSNNDSYSGFIEWLHGQYKIINKNFPEDEQLHEHFHNMKRSFFIYKLKLYDHEDICDNINELLYAMRSGENESPEQLTEELSSYQESSEKSWFDVGDSYDDFMHKKNIYYVYIKNQERSC